MPALNFYEEFADKVFAGIKNQTIRKTRKHPIKRGDTLYLYTGQRTKQCRLLKTVVCVRTFEVKFTKQWYYWRECGWLKRWRKFEIYELEYLAQKDGFGTDLDMIHWFQKHHGLPFEGQVIRWGDE